MTLPVASVATTSAKLDDELRGPQWLDATAYPTIRFVSTRVVRRGARGATVTGDLTFHGVTRPVTLNAVFNGAGTDPIAKAYTVGFDGTATIRRSRLRREDLCAADRRHGRYPHQRRLRAGAQLNPQIEGASS